MNKYLIKNIGNIITIIASILFALWFIKEPSYEPGIGFLFSIGALLTIVLSNRKKSLNKLVYIINIRGLNKNQLKEFMNELTKIYFEISSYKIEDSTDEWKNIIIESKAKINHKDLYNYCRENANGKVYFVNGEGKSFGLITDEGPAKYY